jgi:hypothetical protein
MAALSFMLPSNGRRDCELDKGVNMTFARKLELICSIVLTLLEICLIVFGFQDAYKVSERLNEPPDFFLAIVAAVFFYSLPCLLVVLGSYLHALRRKYAGMIILIVGSSLTILVFFMSLYAIALSGGFANLWGKLNLLALVIAIFTIIISFVVERQNKKAITSL